VSDDEWAFVAPYLTLMREDAPRREHPPREVFNGLLWIVRAGAPLRMLPNDLPPWHTVYQQTQCWIEAGVFEAIVHDLRRLLREAHGRAPEPRAAILDSRTLQSSPESGDGEPPRRHERRAGTPSPARGGTTWRDDTAGPAAAPAPARGCHRPRQDLASVDRPALRSGRPGTRPYRCSSRWRTAPHRPSLYHVRRPSRSIS